MNNILSTIHTTNMLILFIRAIISFALLLFVVRYMGKRQLGEMQPFELIITLVVSELAFLPVVDRNIPLSFGVVTILTIFVIHQVMVVLTKNGKVDRFVSGKPVVVYDSNGIDVVALKAMDMQIGDLLQALRANSHYSLEEITMGIVEKGGQLTVIENRELADRQQLIQTPIIVEGHWHEHKCDIHDVSKTQVYNILREHNAKVSDVILFSVDSDNRITLQTKRRSIVFDTIQGDKILRCPRD